MNIYSRHLIIYVFLLFFFLLFSNFILLICFDGLRDLHSGAKNIYAPSLVSLYRGHQKSFNTNKIITGAIIERC